jgi:iron complex outermembrane recepter protein
MKSNQGFRGCAWMRLYRAMRVCLLACLLVVPALLSAKDSAGDSEDLTDLSLEQLMDIEIVSVSKKGQKVSDVAAAIYVITQDDIRRSGATCIAEALRMAPGVNVGRIGSHKWSISVRGFQEQLVSKLLVMIDGRSVYTPTFSGTYWDMKDYLLEDVERIEIIRGPGATIWGANAVNGVINIITKHSRDTQGGLLTAGGGDEDQALAGTRYGGRIGEAYYRIYAKYNERDSMPINNIVMDGDAHDDWDVLRGGGRIDWQMSEQDHLTLQGDIHYSNISQIGWFGDVTVPSYNYLPVIEDKVTGGNLMGRWTHNMADNSEFTLQLYYDRTQRNDASIDEVRDTIDIDFNHVFGLGERHSLIWGLGYRRSQDSMERSWSVDFDPMEKNDDLASLFIQDEITLIEERLKLTLGSKFEYNDYTGFEVQPSARLLWTLNDRQSIWASVSRAVRTPSRVDSDMTARAMILPPNTVFPGQPLGAFRLQGNKDIDSEQMIAYELGYRIQVNPQLRLDLAGYYNVYDDLIFLGDGRVATPFMEDGLLIFPVVFDNLKGGEIYGFELTADWRPFSCWQLSSSYSYSEMDLDRSPRNRAEGMEKQTPRNQFNIRSYLNLPHNIDFDTTLYYVDCISVPSSHLFSADMPSYIRLDARVAWHPSDNLELSVAAQNLLDPDHPEHYEGTFGTSAYIERSIYGKLTWRF